MARFSTAKREEAAAKLEAAFEEAVPAAEEKSRWRKFIESKPVVATIAGTKAFGKWTATKLKDFGSDMKAAGKSFAEHYRDRQEAKRTQKYIDGCKERGYEVMTKEELEKLKAGISKVEEATAEPAEDTLSGEKKPTPVKIKLRRKGAAAEATAEESVPVGAEIKENLADAAENGTRSERMKQELELLQQFTVTMHDTIQGNLDNMKALDNEQAKQDYMTECMRTLANRFAGVSTEFRNRANEFSVPVFAEPDMEKGMETEGI